jgi:hypothetical protein
MLSVFRMSLVNRLSGTPAKRAQIHSGGMVIPAIIAALRN